MNKQIIKTKAYSQTYSLQAGELYTQICVRASAYGARCARALADRGALFRVQSASPVCWHANRYKDIQHRAVRKRECLLPLKLPAIGMSEPKRAVFCTYTRAHVHMVQSRPRSGHQHRWRRARLEPSTPTTTGRERGGANISTTCARLCGHNRSHPGVGAIV